MERNLENNHQMIQFLHKRSSQFASNEVNYSLGIHHLKKDEKSEEADVRATIQLWETKKKLFRHLGELYRGFSGYVEQDSTKELYGYIDQEKELESVDTNSLESKNIGKFAWSVINKMDNLQTREAADRKDLYARFTRINDRMLEQGKQITPVWKWSGLKIPDTLTDSFYNEFVDLGFESMLINNQIVGETKVDEYGYPELVSCRLPKEKPDSVGMIFDDFDHTKSEGPKWRDTYIAFYYNVEKNSQYEDYNAIRIGLRENSPLVSSYVLSTALMETGYEGHSHKSRMLFNPQLEKMYGLIEKYSQNINSAGTPTA